MVSVFPPTVAFAVWTVAAALAARAGSWTAATVAPGLTDAAAATPTPMAERATAPATMDTNARLRLITLPLDHSSVDVNRSFSFKNEYEGELQGESGERARGARMFPIGSVLSARFCR